MQHLRGHAVRALRSEGLQVDVLGEDLKSKIVQVVAISSLNLVYDVMFDLLHRVSLRLFNYI